MPDKNQALTKQRRLNILFSLLLILGVIFLATANISCNGENCAATANGLEDADADCTDDASDNCPFDYNPLQADADEDGIGDVCEGDASINALPPSSIVDSDDSESDTDESDFDDDDLLDDLSL